MLRLRPFKKLWTLAAIAVLAQLLVAQAMAASSALHECLHDHAGDHGHECVVSLMLDGGYDTVAPDIIPEVTDLGLPPPPLVGSESADSLPSHLIGGVLAHAPPRGP